MRIAWGRSLLLKRQRLWLTCAAAVSLAIFAALPAVARDFTAADTQGGDYPTVQSIQYMDRLVQERSHGRHRINLYPGGMLGAQPATLEQTRSGAIDLNLVNMAPVASFLGEANVLGLPFLFRSAEHLHNVLDSPIGEQLLQRLAPHGLIGLAFYEGGARSVYTSKRPVRTLADFKGMRIRVANSDLLVEMFKTLGAEPVQFPYSLVKTGLSTNLIDAAEQTWPTYIAFEHYAVAPYFTLTEHSMSPDVLLMSSRAWEELSAEDREIFRTAARSIENLDEQPQEALG
jgi:tripartite ATP-independent transporter DctP family solute receptor